MEGICAQHNLTYLNSNFIPDLQNLGWVRVKHYFASNTRGHSRNFSRPLKSGEHTILIPSFIDNNHWVALVRREIHSQVYFLYSDDMNNSSTERTIKTLIQTHTDDIFCPPNSIWIHCKCNTYHPHSNECGPRTILALHVLALHPTPNPEMLLPLMDANLAQIARLWVAASLINGEFHNDVFTYTFSLSQFYDTRISNRASSIPFDYISMNTEVLVTVPQTHNIMPSESSYSLEYSQLSPTTMMDKNHPRISSPMPSSPDSTQSPIMDATR